MKNCKCHWEGHVFYADSDCILDKSNPRYFENLKHDIPPIVPEWGGEAHGLTLEIVEEELKRAWTH